MRTQTEWSSHCRQWPDVWEVYCGDRLVATCRDSRDAARIAGLPRCREVLDAIRGAIGDLMPSDHHPVSGSDAVDLLRAIYDRIEESEVLL